MKGVVLRGIGGFYTVLDEEGGVHTLRAQAKIRREKLKPVVGDHVIFEKSATGDEGWLVSILPRANELTRPSVSNIDVIVVVVAVMSPSPDLMLADRMLLEAARAGIGAMLVVNKIDLCAESAKSICAEYARAGVPTVSVCSLTGEGVSALREALAGKTHAFGGQSGVGKSSLINALYGFELETGDVSERIERGKHTTRRCELIPVRGGGRVLDTPGFSLLETRLIQPETLPEYYPEFAPYAGKCRFSPCLHATEPDCAVRAALDSGDVGGGRYERYIKLLAEVKERWKYRYD